MLWNVSEGDSRETVFAMEGAIKRAVLLVVVVLASWMSAACEKDRRYTDVDPIQVPPGGYLYRAYDEYDREVVRGWLLFDQNSTPSLTFTGTWELEVVGNPGDVGPQNGRGRFEGGQDEHGQAGLNLNPDWFDNNVFLFGPKQGNLFSGKWTYSGIAGPIRGGRFDARRQD